MDFAPLLAKLLPLYALIALGYVAGKKLKIPPQPIARLLIYTIVPVVFFGYTARLQPSPTIVFLPIITWVISALVLGSMWVISRAVFSDARANLSAGTAAGVNAGYFGIPLFAMLFGEQNLGVYVLMVLGFTLNELSLIYFTLARGHYDWRESLRRLLQLPSIYAGIFGIIFAFTGWQLPAPAIEIIAQFRGAYTILGMMMIGLGLSQITKWKCEWHYLALAFLGRFGVTTLLVAALVWINHQTGNWLTTPMLQSFWLICTLPLAANIVAYATDLNLHPDQAAAAVLISTMISAVIIPIAAPFLLQI